MGRRDRGTERDTEIEKDRDKRDRDIDRDTERHVLIDKIINIL